MQKDQVIKVEAESLQEAKKMVASQIPEGLKKLSERILSDGEPKILAGIGESVDLAFTEAMKKVSSNESVIKKEVEIQPENKTLLIQAYDEQTAKQNVLKDDNSVVIKKVVLKTKGRKGIIGIGKKPNEYDIEIYQQAVVKVTVQTTAIVEIIAGLQKMKPVDTMLRQQIIQEWGKSAEYDVLEMQRASNYLSQKSYNLNNSEILYLGKYRLHPGMDLALRTLLQRPETLKDSSKCGCAMKALWLIGTEKAASAILESFDLLWEYDRKDTTGARTRLSCLIFGLLDYEPAIPRLEQYIMDLISLPSSWGYQIHTATYTLARLLGDDLEMRIERLLKTIPEDDKSEAAEGKRLWIKEGFKQRGSATVFTNDWLFSPFSLPQRLPWQ